MDTKNKNILVCDDCVVSCSLFQIVLETEGYNVETANSGAAALAKIEEQAPDLLLLDVTMPGIDGYEIAQRIQQNEALKSLPILMITGYDEETIKQRCQAKIEGVLSKPVNLDKLVAKVAAALRN